MQTKQDSILSVQGLAASFKVGKRTVHAVNSVSFELGRGRILGIVGESGCGKSVTAHSILQLLPKAGRITAGAIDYHPDAETTVRLSDLDRRSKELRALRGADIAMIFQDPMSSLNPVYTVGDQIMENLMEHDKTVTKAEARQRVIELLGSLGIPSPEKRIDEYPHQFSGGMKQRVMIAIAMVCGPKVLIADEPTTALDVTIQAQILELMKKLQTENGTSVILITHNMGIVAEVCDDVAVMYMGRVVESGTLEQVFSDPLHPYTRALLRSVPVLGMGRGEELASIPGATPDAATEFTGCEFADRCTHATDACRAAFPTETVDADGHMVRCHCYAAPGQRPFGEPGAVAAAPSDRKGEADQ